MIGWDVLADPVREVIPASSKSWGLGFRVEGLEFKGFGV